MTIDFRATLQRAADTLPLLTKALLECATRAQDAHVYTSPAAFEAFIRGGGNVPLYERVSAELASHYGPDVHSLLDIGSGDGHALFPALAATAHPHALKRLTLLEPAGALLASAVARAPSASSRRCPCRRWTRASVPSPPNWTWPTVGTSPKPASRCRPSSSPSENRKIGVTENRGQHGKSGSGLKY